MFTQEDLEVPVKVLLGAKVDLIRLSLFLTVVARRKVSKINIQVKV